MNEEVINMLKENLDISERQIRVVLKLLGEDLILVSNENIKLTKKGLDLANLVWEEFV